MSFLFRISAVCYLIAQSLFSLGQAYEAPKPKMNKKVFKHFLNTQLVYPAIALTNNKQGAVTINFSIDEAGHIKSREIESSVSKDVDSAALALFDLILWYPPYHYGNPVNGTGSIKIKYNIGKYESLVKKRGYDQLPIPVENKDQSGIIYTLKNLDIAPEAILDSNYLSLAEYISKSLVFPESASKLSISGDVKLRFVIETSGLSSNLIVIETVGGGCTEEAIRIVQELKWIPGIKENLAVRTCYNVSIKFDPADQLRSKHIPNQTNTGM